MQNKSHTISESDDSESVDDPSPVPSVENTQVDPSPTEKNSEGTEKNEAVSSSEISSNLAKEEKKSPKKVKKESSDKDEGELRATFSIKDLSPDDEVYIFHCTENFEKQDLLNKFINVSKSKQFVHSKDGQKFQLEILNTDNKKLTLAVPKSSSKGKLVNLPLKGHMIIKKPVDFQTNLINYLEEADDKVEFPNDIKVRHPFLGADWKAHIDEAKQSMEKINSSKKVQKKKRKREKNEDEKIKQEGEEHSIKIKEDISSDDHSPKKKRKKA